VIGYANVSAPSGFNNHAVLWTRSGTAWTILELLPSSVQSIAWGINALGYIVGQDGTHAFVRAPGGAVTTLPTMGGTTAAAFGINDAGEISGYASTAGGQRRAVLWLPNGGGYSTKDLGKPFGGIGFRLNEPSGGATEVVGSATSAILWTAR
jgi:probable HAF family extracellular repeat protein